MENMSASTEKNRKEVKPLNQDYVLSPFIFKTTGEVRRCKKARRFSRQLSLMVSRMVRELVTVTFLTVADDNTVYILSREQSHALIENDTNIEAMLLNGWQVYPTNMANVELIPAMTQGDLL